MKRHMTTGERIRMERERRECIAWAIACLVAGMLCCALMHYQAALDGVRVTMEVRR